MRCLSIFSGCGWAYAFTLTSLPPQTLPQWLKAYLMQAWKPCHYKAVEPFKLHPHTYWGVWAPSQVVDGHMASHSHQYRHRHLPRFVKVGWNPIWCKCANHATTFWFGFRIFQTAFHVHGIHIWEVWTPSGCQWAYGFTLTSLPPQTLPQIWESWLKSDLMQVCKPCHYKVVEPFKLHPMRCLSTSSGCGWAYGFTLTPLPP